MPATLIAAAVLLVLVVPGYLFQAGVRERSHVLAAERDVYAIAQAVALSTGLLLILFVIAKAVDELFGSSVVDHLLHDPTNPDDRGLAWGQVGVLVGLLVFSNAVGKLVGGYFARRRKTRLAKPNRRFLSKAARKPLDLLLSESPLDRRFDETIDVASARPAYVRIIRQGEEDAIGLMDADAAKASASSLGSGIALSARWTRDEEGRWTRQASAHVAKPGMIEVLSWTGEEPRPAWAEDLPPLSEHAPQTSE
jgi:hypothetical protein